VIFHRRAAAAGEAHGSRSTGTLRLELIHAANPELRRRSRRDFPWSSHDAPGLAGTDWPASAVSPCIYASDHGSMSPVNCDNTPA